MKTKIKLIDKRAVIPTKAHETDSGYDITIISLKKELDSGVKLYGTGISVSPEDGWYFDLVPRGSISKTGHMLANSVGVIDHFYTGEILVPIIKINEDSPNISLPSKLFQLIPRRYEDVSFIEVESLDETDRGEGRFGSTDK